MKIPSKLKIMGHKYTIKKISKLVLRKGTCGDGCVNIKKIRLDTTVLKSQRDEALLHEIIEMLKYHLDLPLEHQNLAALSEGLYQVIHDNKLKF